jgi:hypothetical protein
VALFYRVVHERDPAIDDFRSPAALGETPRRRLTPKQWDGWRAVSMYSTLAAAEGLSRRTPERGTWIATVDLPDDGSIRWEQQGRDLAHHNV